MILLMVQKSGGHQLRLVVYPIIYRVLAPSQVVSRISEPSTVFIMKHFETVKRMKFLQAMGFRISQDRATLCTLRSCNEVRFGGSILLKC